MATRIDPQAGRLTGAGASDTPAHGGRDGAHRAAPIFPASAAMRTSVLRRRVGDEWRIEVHVAGHSHAMLLDLTLAEADALAEKLRMMARLRPGKPPEDAARPAPRPGGDSIDEILP